MNARRVHAVLAAGVQHPDQIARWLENSQFLLKQGVLPESIDLSALWKFAGLTAKVRHNSIRREFPITFRLMGVAGLEIDVFASYATYCASKAQRLAATVEERACDLIVFLEKWLDLGEMSHSLLWDVIRHEHAIARLSRPAPMASPLMKAEHASTSRGVPSESSVPYICGVIILHQMRCDPRTVESAVFQNQPRLDQIIIGPRYFCYWLSKRSAEILILELDEFGFYVLSFVDGARSIRALNRGLCGRSRPTKGFLRSMSQLATIGILDF